MMKPLFALTFAALLGLSVSARADEDDLPPALAVPLEEGVRAPFPILEPLALRPADAAPEFALPDAAGNLISSRAWLSQRSLLVLSLAAPASANPDAPALAVAAAAPLLPEQVLVARRVAEAVRLSATRLQRRGVAIVVIASGPYFRALNDAMGVDFKPSAVPEVLEPDSPNLFVLRDDFSHQAPGAAPVPFPDAILQGGRRIKWSALAGRTESGVSLSAIDRAGFVRSNEAVSDLLNLESLLVLTGDVTPSVDIGQRAPDFSMRDANGRVRRLSDLRGQRNLLLTFFPKCFTGG